MPLHHYLPASFIARFSADLRKVSGREKRVIVGDKREQKCFHATAGNVGCINNLYTLADDSGSPEVIDQTWAIYEKKLPAALDRLIYNTVDAETWTRVLVPFVACMLVRGPDFEGRFLQRFPPSITKKMSGLFTSDHANRARLREIPLLLTAVLAAKWLVLRAHGKEKIITNDLGYAPFANPLTGDQGLAIPLNHRTVLAIIPDKQNRTLLYEREGEWVPDIKYGDLPPGNQKGLNDALAVIALRFIFGPDYPTMQKYLAGNHENYTAPEPDELGFPDLVSKRAFEFTWFRLVSAIQKKPLESTESDFSLNWEVIKSDWFPTPFIPLNLIEFPPALNRVGNQIELSFHNPEIYYKISEILFLEDNGDLSSAINVASQALDLNLDPLERTGMLLKRAELSMKRGDIVQALADRDAALDIAPNQDIKNHILNRRDLRLPFWSKLKISFSKLGK